VHGNDGHQAVVLAESFSTRGDSHDLGMPRLDGLEASRKIRAQPWGKAIRIIALTGWGRSRIGSERNMRALICTGSSLWTHTLSAVFGGGAVARR